MPYNSTKDLPEKVKNNLTSHGQEIFVAAFNNAMKEYGDESRAFATAYSAAKKAGEYKTVKKLAESWIIAEGGIRVIKKDRTHFAAIHPSAKNPGMWQLTYHSEKGPGEDSQHESPRKAADYAKHLGYTDEADENEAESLMTKSMMAYHKESLKVSVGKLLGEWNLTESKTGTRATAWKNENGYETNRCACGNEPNTHPNASYNLDYCANCGKATCNDCRTYNHPNHRGAPICDDCTKKIDEAEAACPECGYAQSKCKCKDQAVDHNKKLDFSVKTGKDKVLGITPSGKKIYNDANHEEHKNFSQDDHAYAAGLHRGIVRGVSAKWDEARLGHVFPHTGAIYDHHAAQADKHEPHYDKFATHKSFNQGLEDGKGHHIVRDHNPEMK